MDTLDLVVRSGRMSRVRGKNTGPELTVRRLIHALGTASACIAVILPDPQKLPYPSPSATTPLRLFQSIFPLRRSTTAGASVRSSASVAMAWRETFTVRTGFGSM